MLNVKPIFDNLPANWVRDYLSYCGIKDVDKYITASKADFDNPDLYDNIDKCYNYLKDYIKNPCTIAIIPEADVDECCSGAIVYLFCDYLNQNGCNIKCIPYWHTQPKSHGLTHDSEDKVLYNILKDKNEIDLVWLTDSSATHESEKLLSENGIGLLVTDHHNTKDTDNENNYVINNTYQDSTNEFACGTVVTYKFIKYVCEKLNIESPDYNDILALATVADVMNLTALENRAILNELKITNPFLEFLFNKLNKDKPITPKNIAFNIAPKLNACYRITEEEPKKMFFEALVGVGDYKKAYKSFNFAQRTQKQMVSELLEELKENVRVEKNCVIGIIDSQYKTLTGLIASRLSSQYNRPCFVIREYNENTYTGSLRSPVNISSIINDSGLAKAKGHEQAAGIEIEKNNLNNFIEYLNDLELGESEEIVVLSEINNNKLNLNLCKAYEKARRFFGKGIDEPKFYTKVKTTNYVIYRKKSNTLVIYGDENKFIKFNVPDDEAKLLEKNASKGKPIEFEIVFTPEINEYNGLVTAQGNINVFDWTANLMSAREKVENLL